MLLEGSHESMTLRHFPTDGGDPLPKLPNFNVPSESSSFIFGSAVEVATGEELHLLWEDYHRNYKGFHTHYPSYKLDVGNSIDVHCKNWTGQFPLTLRNVYFENSFDFGIHMCSRSISPYSSASHGTFSGDCFSGNQVSLCVPSVQVWLV